MSTILYYLGMVIGGFALLVMLGIPLSLWEGRAKRKKMEVAFSGREPLSEDSFYERYFQPRGVPADVVIKIRRILEDELNADLSRLSAEDDFSRNLSFFWEYDSLSDVEIIMRLEEEFGIQITDAEAEKSGTVEGIVSLVWSKLHPREA